MKYNVLMTDTIFPDTAIEESSFDQGNMEFQLSPGSDVETLAEHGQAADALLVVYAPVSADLIERLPNCKVIVRAGIGYNNVDLDAATRRGIKVANVPDYCQDEVADHTLALLLALGRKVCLLDESIRAGSWNANLGRDAPRFRGKTLGLLGCGAIGLEVAHRAAAFGMHVVGFDPYAASGLLEEHNIERAVDFDGFLASIDFLSLHLPLTADTRYIIDHTALGKMKSSALIVNTSRGGLIQEDDLYAALNSGEIAGAALDVLECEPPDGIPKLADLENTLITPHTAFLSENSVDELRKKASMEVIRTLKEGRPKHQVN
ncbi:MAG: C-terminal binding protein [Natronospirillum sp.]|uniref:C-terminal binding protein n=1 Tax=Natronospirillum sp. TaxID=2812955 RepID=UPI0025F56F2A|nr:C-terminal binding protein [Natronospirillum sp.]MCH8551901.1 C-terminal binding protein [Natronospirillum sp.]